MRPFVYLSSLLREYALQHLNHESLLGLVIGDRPLIFLLDWLPRPFQGSPMPRRARLSLPGVPWHIIQRGNNRSVCFRAEEDYQFYLHYLHEFAVKFGCTVHA